MTSAFRRSRLGFVLGVFLLAIAIVALTSGFACSSHQQPKAPVAKVKPSIAESGPTAATARAALAGLKPSDPVKHNRHIAGSIPVTWSLTSDQWGPDADHRVDIYAPNDGVTHGALLFVHGGGWVSDVVDGFTLALFEGIARNNGWILGVAYYPVTADAGSRVDQTELNAVTTDLNQLRAQPHVDGSKVAVYGESAGGELGGMVAYQNPTKVAAVVTSSGPTNMITEEKSTYNFDGVNIKNDVDFFEGETYAASAATNPYDFRYPLTSPVSFVNASTPPTFAYADGNDPIVPSLQYIEFQSVLNRYGVNSVVRVMSGSTHCPDSQVPTVPAGNTETAMQQGLDFINTVEGT